MNKIVTTGSAEETMALAREFALKLKRGDVIALYGELGSGKTQFTKGVCSAFSAAVPATSPSFVILNRYDCMDNGNRELLIYHFDLYRIRSAEEIYDLGYEELLFGGNICLIEWAEVLGGMLPEPRYDIHFQYGKHENERIIEISGVGI